MGSEKIDISKEIWSIRENGSKVKGLVGIVSNKSNWFIAEEVLTKHAIMICDLFNKRANK